MKKFMCLHYGFTPPTPQIMEAWGTWFEEVAGHTVEPGSHFSRGKEISADGVRDLPLGPDSITGYTILEAETLEQAETLAGSNPFITAIRVYEMADGDGHDG